MDDSRMKSLMFMENGAKLIDDGDEHTFAFRAIIIREDTVIEEWEDQDGLDLVAYYDISGVTLSVTDPILMVPGGLKNGKFELTSGSAWVIY